MFVAWTLLGSHARGDPDGPEEVRVRGSYANAMSTKSTVDDSPREVTDATALIEGGPGIHVRHFGGDDSFSTLSIRGSSSQQIATYLGGIPISGGADPTLDVSSLPVFPGGAARIYRTFVPASVGPSSLGGTLVLDPIGSTCRAESWGAAGSYGTLKLRTLAGGKVHGVDVCAAVAASRSDGQFQYFDAARKEFFDRLNNGHAKWSGYLQNTYESHLAGGRALVLRTRTLVQMRRQELPGALSAPTPFEVLQSWRILNAFELSLPDARDSWSLRGWSRADARVVTGGFDTFSGFRKETNDQISAFGASAGGKFGLSKMTKLDAHVDGEVESWSARTYHGVPQPLGAHRSRLGVGIDLGVQPTESFNASATGRVDGWNESSAQSSAADLLPTVHAGWDWHVGPWALIGHAGYVSRPPSFVERFGNAGAFRGDPNLRAEQAWAADLGTRFTHRSKRGSLQAELVAFGMLARDLITFVPAGAEGRLLATNLGRAHLAGTELSAEATLARVSLRASYTFLASENLGACDVTRPGCTPPPLPGRPRHDFSADLSYRFHAVRVRYGLDVLSGMNADLSRVVIVPARVLHGAGAEVRLPGDPRLSFGVEMRNLGDLRTAGYAGPAGPVEKAIGDVYDYPLPGRSLLVTARFREETPRE